MPKPSRSKPSNVRRAPISGPLPKLQKKILSDDEEEVAASRKLASRSKPSNVRPAPIRGPPLKLKKKFLPVDEEEVAASRNLPTIFVRRPGTAHLPPPPKPIVSGPIEGCQGGIKVKFRGYTFLTVPPCPPAPPAEANTGEEQHGSASQKRGVRRFDTD